MTGKTLTQEVALQRAKMQSRYPWFAILASHLKVQEDQRVRAVATDGTSLFINPEWWHSLTEKQAFTTLAEQAFVCALGHPYRCKGRDMATWVRASTLVACAHLSRDGFTDFWPGAEINPEYAKLPVETVYARLMAEAQQQQDGDEGDDSDSPEQGPPVPGPSQGKGKPGDKPSAGASDEPGDGDDGDDDQSDDDEQADDGPPQPDMLPAERPQPGNAPNNEPDQDAAGTPKPMSAMDWSIAANEASNVTRRRGDLPGDSVIAVKESQVEPEDWRAVLKDWVDQSCPTDLSWIRPDRRFISSGTYMPGYEKEGLPFIGIGYDTSGSITAKDHALLFPELKAILQDAKPERIEVVYCDARVQATEEFTSDDFDVQFQPRGGGGTRFQPVFDYWNDPQHEMPVCAIYFTADLEGENTYGAGPEDPGYPVLWVTSERSTREPPFGRVIRIRE